MIDGMVKRKKPMIDDRLYSRESALSAMINADAYEYNIERFLFSDEKVENLHITDVQMRQCVFSNCSFIDCVFEGVSFIDCIFKDCNISLLNMSNGAINCSEFDNCSALGLALPSGVMSNVGFQNTKLRFANFFSSRISYVEFISCDMKSVSMDNCNIKRTEFSNCDLTEADFCRTSLRNIDLRTNEIEGIKFEGGEFDETVVDAEQAVKIAQLIGLRVQ